VTLDLGQTARVRRSRTPAPLPTSGPYLRTKSRSRARRCVHGGELLRVGDDPFRRNSDVVHRLRGLDLERAQPVGPSPRTERAHRSPRSHRPNASSAAPSSFLVRVVERGPQRFRVGEQLFLGNELVLFVGVDDLGRVDLGELVPEQVDGARPQVVVAADRGHLLVNVTARSARDQQRRTCGCRGCARKPIEQITLFGGHEERLVRVLPMEIHERAPALTQLGRTREATVDITARASEPRE